MNSIYRCVDRLGQCYEFRGDSEDSCQQLMYIARACFPDADLVDLCGVEDDGEIRAKREDEDAIIESDYLKWGEYCKKIPLIIPPKSCFTTEKLQKLCERLIAQQSGEKYIEQEVELEAKGTEQIDVPQEEDEAVEVPLVEVPEHKEILEAEEAEEAEQSLKEEEEIRPFVFLRVIEAQEAKVCFAGAGMFG